MPAIDWAKVNWFAFFPPAFAIYLALIGLLMKVYLASRVNIAVGRSKPLQPYESFLFNLASGWATQLSFINAMFAALISAMSIWSASKSYAGVSITILLLVMIFVPIMWVLFTHEPDEIVAKSGKFGTPAQFCRWLLIAVNLGLIVAIFIAQQTKP
jgi:hypothetical protein